MDVKKCDRCGAVYGMDFGLNERGTNFVMLADSQLIGPSVGNLSRSRFMCEGSPVEIRDLCRGCAEDFKRWFKRRM